MKKHITKKILKKREKRALKRALKTKIGQWKELIMIRDNCKCQRCNKDLTNERKHVHHIIALQAVKRNYIDLIDNLMNGILLCSYCHKFAPFSPHQGSLEFVLWLEKNKHEQYLYLKEYLFYKQNNSINQTNNNSQPSS